MRRYTKFAIVVALILVMTLFLLIPSLGPSSEAYVLVNSVKVSVVIADNVESRTKGLMFSDRLSENHGMIFVFESEGNYPFWMMNMRFNLDIIWIDSKGEVVHIAKNMPPCGIPCLVIDPKTNARYVLEVNAGFVDKHKIGIGSVVHMFLPER